MHQGFLMALEMALVRCRDGTPRLESKHACRFVALHVQGEAAGRGATMRRWPARGS